MLEKKIQKEKGTVEGRDTGAELRQDLMLGGSYAGCKGNKPTISGALSSSGMRPESQHPPRLEMVALIEAPILVCCFSET